MKLRKKLTEWALSSRVEYLEYRIGKLELRPGDILVGATDLMLDKDQAAFLRERLQVFAPNNKILILSHGIKLGVIREENADGL